MGMRLYGAAASPFVRTARVVIEELGLSEDVDLEPTPVKPTEPNAAFQEKTPLRRVPALQIEDGLVIVDSPVICEYLADRVGDTRLFARSAPDRWVVLTDYAIARQVAELSVAARYEATVRPEPLRWSVWTDDLFDKITAALSRFDAAPPARGRLTIADVALGASLDYLSFRFSEFDWPSRFPALAQWFAPIAARPSFEATRPS